MLKSSSWLKKKWTFIASTETQEENYGHQIKYYSEKRKMNAEGKRLKNNKVDQEVLKSSTSSFGCSNLSNKKKKLKRSKSFHSSKDKDGIFTTEEEDKLLLSCEAEEKADDEPLGVGGSSSNISN